MYKPQKARAGAVLFADLLQQVAEAAPEMRIRFTSPHPKDCGDDVLQVRPGTGLTDIVSSCLLSACKLLTYWCWSWPPAVPIMAKDGGSICRSLRRIQTFASNCTCRRSMAAAQCCSACGGATHETHMTHLYSASGTSCPRYRLASLYKQAFFGKCNVFSVFTVTCGPCLTNDLRAFFSVFLILARVLSIAHSRVVMEGRSAVAADERSMHWVWLPQIALSTDLISGFCGETEEDHAATLDLLQRIGYDQAFLFSYSSRDKTHAARHLQARALSSSATLPIYVALPMQALHTLLPFQQSHIL